MNISLNEKEVSIDKQISLEELFNQYDIKATKGVAVAVNEMIIPKKEWSSYNLRDNDKILVITATQGG